MYYNIKGPSDGLLLSIYWQFRQFAYHIWIKKYTRDTKDMHVIMFHVNSIVKAEVCNNYKCKTILTIIDEYYFTWKANDRRSHNTCICLYMYHNIGLHSIFTLWFEIYKFSGFFFILDMSHSERYEIIVKHTWHCRKCVTLAIRQYVHKSSRC